MATESGTASNETIREHVAAVLDELLRERLDQAISKRIAEFVRANELRAKELSLMERVVRVEEELKALWSEMAVGFERCISASKLWPNGSRRSSGAWGLDSPFSPP